MKTEMEGNRKLAELSKDRADDAEEFLGQVREAHATVLERAKVAKAEFDRLRKALDKAREETTQGQILWEADSAARDKAFCREMDIMAARERYAKLEAEVEEMQRSLQKMQGAVERNARRRQRGRRREAAHQDAQRLASRLFELSIKSGENGDFAVARAGGDASRVGAIERLQGSINIQNTANENVANCLAALLAPESEDSTLDRLKQDLQALEAHEIMIQAEARIMRRTWSLPGLERVKRLEAAVADRERDLRHLMDQRRDLRHGPDRDRIWELSARS